MMYAPISTAALLAAALLASVPLGAQTRQVRRLTTSLEQHSDARISPDGTLVAFRAPGKLGIVPYMGGTESTLVTSNSITDFLWAPSGSGLYYLDGANIRFVARFGGNSTSIATVPGGSHRIWSVDASDSWVYGSRLEPSTSEYRIFRVRANGSAAPVDIVNGAGNLVDEAMVSPNGTKLAYRSYLAFPFTPREYLIANADGSSPVLVTNPAVNGDPTSMAWLDNSHLVFSAVDQVSARPHLWRTTTSGAVEALTGGLLARRNPSVSANGKYVVCEAQAPSGPSIPAVMGTTGGGLVSLLPLSRTSLYIFRGSPSIDGAGQRVAFAGRLAGSSDFDQVHVVDLDREMEVSPRVQVPGVLSISMPLAAGEAGGIFMGFSQIPFVIPLFAFNYGVALDPATLLFLTSGTGSGGSLSLSIPLPNDPTISGFQFWLQGLRFGTVTGDFTREVLVQVF